MIQITTPDGASVKHYTQVTGRVWPKEGFVQVLVRAADGRWYTQKLTKKQGHKWHCDIVLGFPDWTHTSYVVAAGVDGERILESSVTELPSCTTWSYKCVERVKE